MKTLYVAFVWNQHQPYYQDAEKKEYIMPWARLHAAKDYYSMAAILEEYPAIHQTFNLTPSLLEQIEDYLQGSEDYYQRVMKEAEKLTPWEKRFLLHHYFDIQWDRVIARHPRYHQLLNLQGRTREPEAVREALERFTTRDYRDLQAWFNLAWMDPDLRRKDPFLNGLEEKGEGFTVQEVKTLMEKQMEILRRVVPEHRRLMERKQIEIITTPFYHPIMPLIIDSHSALRASPGLPLPGHRFRYPEDAYAQLKLSREQYRRLFGTLPRGVWPPEQAVSPECIPIFNDLGFAWTISDEQVLARSLDVEIVRDGYGHVLNGDVLYRPYQVKAEGGEITMIFRDHHLSDRIGFEYQHFPPEEAAADLVHRLNRIWENLQWSPQEHLVTISLDGENAWEWYQGDKGPFLHSLYRRLSGEKHLRCVTVSEYLAKYPPQRQISRLFTGSWVDHSLARWIGTGGKNALWNQLAEARQAIESYRKRPDADPGKLEQALRNIYIAEGSDYPWWIDSMPYYLSVPFEALFRKHLANVYRALGLNAPSYLGQPLVAPRPGEAAWQIDPLSGPIPMVPAHSPKELPEN
ncbi:MAG TPA: glycoside hydrolase family 57 protein [Bacillota bacterium]|mgnify:CR=1 FL=1|jgi:alpha-amylase/alpha-mannosidase (GH57 family)|nr:glycoside hydrolase [Bacillota bacterium]HOB86893.1 glycoside hydrolase family 57 protein [Bacillota bacterium]HOP68539.1 glycoside hydrolase family 57 protein [Bacillota bacterium]HPT33232.1 glycoside hydrolase family 57 protein [Bacillota bacterium]HQD05625.1 glycoside hydrolase family 57 protein [Bacillota bacterium]